MYPVRISGGQEKDDSRALTRSHSLVSARQLLRNRNCLASRRILCELGHADDVQRRFGPAAWPFPHFSLPNRHHEVDDDDDGDVDFMNEA